MKILQQAIKVKRHSRVQVTFSRPATIYLMTEVNFKRYKDGASFRRLGGHFDNSPAEFVAPYDGTWHAVIEKGSHFNAQPITGSVEVLPPLLKDTPYFEEDEDITPEAATEEEYSEPEDSYDEDNSDSEEHQSEEEETDSDDEDKS